MEIFILLTLAAVIAAFAFREDGMEGKFDPKKEQFYYNCKRKNVSDFSDFESLRIGKEIYKECYGDCTGVDANKLKKMYLQGEKKVLKREAKKQKELENKKAQKAKLDEMYKTVPKSAEINEKERQFLDFANKIKNLDKDKKRREIIREKVRIAEKEVEKLKQKVEESKQLETFARHYYAPQEKDWALLGGIAEGIAGPVAGVAVAMDAMAENERNREENKNMQVLSLFAGDLLKSNTKNILEQYREAEAKRNSLLSEMNSTFTKIIFSEMNKDEIFSKLEIKEKAKYKKGVLYIVLDIKNNIKGSHMTVDGTIQAKIYCGEVFVGEACIPLPVYGVECENTSICEGICTKYMVGKDESDYRIELYPNKLWLMEV